MNVSWRLNSAACFSCKGQSLFGSQTVSHSNGDKFALFSIKHCMGLFCWQFCNQTSFCENIISSAPGLFTLYIISYAVSLQCPFQSTTSQFCSLTKNAFCLVQFCDFSFLKAIFLASLDSPDCFPLWGGGRKKFLGTAALSADVNFPKKKSRFLDVVLLLNTVHVILKALMMFYQWQLEARFHLFGRYSWIYIPFSQHFP